MTDGIRLSFDLVSLMQLNLVRRRMTTLAYGQAFVHPDDIRALVDILDEYFPSEMDIQSLYKGRSNATSKPRVPPTRTPSQAGMGPNDDPEFSARG